MDDLKKFCCHHKECLQYGIRGGENIRVRDTYGPNNTHLLQCRTCKKRFSERCGTIFFDCRLPEKTVVSIVEHVIEGTGMRKTDRLQNVDPGYRPPKDLVYATVHKTRVKGRVKKIDYRMVFGTEEQVQAALKQSRCSRKPPRKRRSQKRRRRP